MNNILLVVVIIGLIILFPWFILHIVNTIRQEKMEALPEKAAFQKLVYRERVAVRELKLPYQLEITLSNIWDLLKRSKILSVGVIIVAAGIMTILLSSLFFVERWKIAFAIVGGCFIAFFGAGYITYYFILYLLPERKKVASKLRGLSPEEIVRRVLHECSLYINNLYQLSTNGRMNGLPQLLSQNGLDCLALIKEGSRLLECRKEILIDVFFNGIDLPIIKRDFLAKKANQRDLEQLEKEKQQRPEEVASRLVEIETFEELLSTGTTFPPEDLKDKMSYDDSRKLLIFKGVMSKNEKDKLLNLSQDVQYRKAIEALFQKPLVEEEIERRKEIIKRIEDRIKEIRTRITDLESDRLHILSYVITRVLNEPSTGKACRNYMRKLSGILKISTEENWKENVRFLTTLVDLRRGVQVSKLLGIKRYFENINNLKVYSKEFDDLSNVAIHRICENFRNNCTSLCPQQNEEGRCPVITIGYSQVVRRIIANCAEKCNRILDIYILCPKEEREFWLHEVEIMKIELEGYERVSPQVIDLDVFMDNDLHNNINYMLLGTENIKSDGHVFHASDHNRIIKKIREGRRDRGEGLRTIICAESYKVKDIEFVDHTRVMSCTPEEYNYIVTDRDVFEVKKVAFTEKPYQLPTGITFPPEDLKDKMSYDDSRKLLIFKGVMSKNEKDKLLNLSQDVQYRKAIEALFQKPQKGYKFYSLQNGTEYENLSIPAKHWDDWVGKVLTLQADEPLVGFRYCIAHLPQRQQLLSE